jgi:hypothetical protein
MPPVITPSRLWFSYSLQTLFVLVTVFAVWLGWEQHIVRARRLLKTATESGGGRVFSYDPEYPLNAKVPTIPIWRTWCEDVVIDEIALTEGTDSDEQQRIQSWFPEARVCRMEPARFPIPKSGALGRGPLSAE